MVAQVVCPCVPGNTPSASAVHVRSVSALRSRFRSTQGARIVRKEGRLLHPCPLIRHPTTTLKADVLHGHMRQHDGRGYIRSYRELWSTHHLELNHLEAV